MRWTHHIAAFLLPVWLLAGVYAAIQAFGFGLFSSLSFGISNTTFVAVLAPVVWLAGAVALLFWKVRLSGRGGVKTPWWVWAAGAAAGVVLLLAPVGPGGRFPGGRNPEERTWLMTSQDHPGALRQYAERYPASRHASAARARVETLEGIWWRKAIGERERRRQADYLRVYLDCYPQGEYREEAEAKLKELAGR